MPAAALEPEIGLQIEEVELCCQPAQIITKEKVSPFLSDLMNARQQKPVNQPPQTKQQQKITNQEQKQAQKATKPGCLRMKRDLFVDNNEAKAAGKGLGERRVHFAPNAFPNQQQQPPPGDCVYRMHGYPQQMTAGYGCGPSVPQQPQNTAPSYGERMQQRYNWMENEMRKRWEELRYQQQLIQRQQQQLKQQHCQQQLERGKWAQEKDMQKQELLRKFHEHFEKQKRMFEQQMKEKEEEIKRHQPAQSPVECKFFLLEGKNCFETC